MKLSLLNDSIRLDYTDANTMENGEMVGGIYLPSGSSNNAVDKTVTCKILDIAEETARSINAYIGDEILVDRYAIMKIEDPEFGFIALIKPASIIMVKRDPALGSKFTPNLEYIDDVIDALLNAPKKCYFSLFNYMQRVKGNTIATQCSDKLKKITAAYSKNTYTTKMSLEDYAKAAKEDPTIWL